MSNIGRHDIRCVRSKRGHIAGLVVVYLGTDWRGVYTPYNKSRVVVIGTKKRKKNPGGGEEVADDVYYRVVWPPSLQGPREVLCRRGVGLNENLWGAHNGISVGAGGRRRRAAAVSGPCVLPRAAECFL